MKSTISALFLLALIAGLSLPGGAAYIGAYIAMGIGALGLLLLGWRERLGFTHPVSLAIFLAIALVGATVPFVYKGEADLLAPVFILPMLTTIGLGLMAGPAGRLPDPVFFAALCLIGACAALLGGAYEVFVLDASRAGLGNNPIHYGSLAAMTGGLALVGAVSTSSPWRCIFLLGPVLGLGATVLSGSRGPLAGALAIASVGVIYLLIWYWRDRLLRFSLLAALLLGAVLTGYLVHVGNDRVTRIMTTAFNVFSFTGSRDDVRAALYASALHVLEHSPAFGVGFGSIMVPVKTLFPELMLRSELENLHADWANFAAMAGVPGLLAWLLLSLAPLTLLLDPLARTDRAIVLGAMLLVTGQLVLGVTNAMFGVIPQTMLYAVALGYLLARARRISIAAGTARTQMPQQHR